VNCEEARMLVHPYADGELDLVKSLELERHLKDCAECAREFAAIGALRATLDEGDLRYAAPERLVQRVIAAAHPRPRIAGIGGSFALPRASWGLLAAAAVVVGFVIFFKGRAAQVGGPYSVPYSIDNEVMADHVRSLMADHLTDVLSTNQHTVKPWFEGKVNYSPTVVDLSDKGFVLVGGRLDYLDNRAVTAVVYRRHLHVINLFQWPATHPGDESSAVESSGGFNLVHWTKGGMSYWAVSDLNLAELEQFARTFQTGGSAPAVEQR
jgi:anti-sigma factor RsiW